MNRNLEDTRLEISSDIPESNDHQENTFKIEWTQTSHI